MISRNSNTNAFSMLMAIGLLAIMSSFAHAVPVVSFSSAFTDDASTGIDSSKTYTHTVSGGSAAIVNGVNFDKLDAGNTPANFSWNTNGFNKNQIGCCNNGDWNPAAGGVTGAGTQSLLGSFTFSSNGDGSPAHQTFTLSGLTPGQTYDSRVYIRVWDTEGSGRPIDMTFTNGGATNGLFFEDRPTSQGYLSDHNAYYVNARYTAGASGTFEIDAEVEGNTPSGSFHLYALSNELVRSVAVPEPATATLGLLGVCGLVMRRRRTA